MSASDPYLELLKDCLRALGPVSARRMFGGAGIFADGLMFGLVIDDTLYLKADGETEARFEAEGLAPFSYNRNGRMVALSYRRAPERLLDDPDEMLIWAQLALAVARRTSANSPRAKTPRAKESRVRAPRAQTPRAQTPRAQTPRAQTPRVKPPRVKPPRRKGKRST